MGSSCADNNEQFCLRWNDYQDSITSSLGELRRDRDFLDVTLMCADGGPNLMAHKVVLSACSAFFKSVLKRNSTSQANPLIVLWDVHVEDLETILNFMYNGEVRVRQENLNSFLSVAERLRVRGLCQSDSNLSQSPAAAAAAAAASQHQPQPRPHNRIRQARRRSSSTSPGNSSSKPSSPKRACHNNCGGEGGGGTSSSPSQKQDEDSSGGGGDVSGGRLPIKEEEGGGNHHQNDEADDGDGDEDPEENNKHHQEETSLMSRDSDYSEYGYGGGQGGDGPDRYADAKPIPAPVVGLEMGERLSPHMMMDPSIGKGLWGLAGSRSGHRLGSNDSFGGGSGGGGGGGNHPRRPRSVYTTQQLTQLEAYFRFNEYIDGERKKQLSIITQIPEQQIKVWFQNRRQKKKREVEEHSGSGSLQQSPGGSLGTGGGIPSPQQHQQQQQQQQLQPQQQQQPPPPPPLYPPQ